MIHMQPSWESFIAALPAPPQHSQCNVKIQLDIAYFKNPRDAF